MLLVAPALISLTAGQYVEIKTVAAISTFTYLEDFPSAPAYLLDVFKVA
jgi:hypothetical protein